MPPLHSLSLASSTLLLALAVCLAAPAPYAQSTEPPSADAAKPARASEAAAFAAAPESFAFQGVLEDGGQPIADGSYAVSVRLFDAATGGTVVYAETHSVQTSGGVFALSVGDGTLTSTTPFRSINLSDAVWIEVDWEGTTLSPRTPIESAPVARTLRAGARVDGLMSVVEESGNAVLRVENTRASGSSTAISGEVESSDGYAASLTGGRGLRIRTGVTVASASTLLNEDVLVQSDDAVVGMYSNDAGAWGSALVLGEMALFGQLENKWAVARGTGDTGALHFTFGTNANYASNDTQMRIDTDGSVHADGSFTGGGADFAEWLPLASSMHAPRAGDVVGVTGGRVGLTTDGAEQVMIISSNPAFAGNPDAAEGGALVALVGQAEVRLASSTAQIGDLLVPSGLGDGTARAVSPAHYDPATDGPVIGRVLALAGADRAVALVGVDEAAALRAVVVRQQDELATQQHQLDVLRADRDRQQAQIDALVRRLDRHASVGTH